MLVNSTIRISSIHVLQQQQQQNGIFILRVHYFKRAYIYLISFTFKRPSKRLAGNLLWKKGGLELTVSSGFSPLDGLNLPGKKGLDGQSLSSIAYRHVCIDIAIIQHGPGC